MSEPGAVPLPREGQVFFDVRGESRSMRLSWYADSAVAVFSIWQGNRCTGTFRLPFGDLARMVQTLQSGPHGTGTGYGDAGDYQAGHYPPGDGADYAYAAGDYGDAGYNSAGYDEAGYEADAYDGYDDSGYNWDQGAPDAGYTGGNDGYPAYQGHGYQQPPANYENAGYDGASYQGPGDHGTADDGAGYGPSGHESPRSYENPSSYADLGYEHPGSYASASGIRSANSGARPRHQRHDADWETATASYPQP